MVLFLKAPKMGFSFASPSTPSFTKPQHSHAKVEVHFYPSAAFHGLLATSQVPRRKRCPGPPRDVCSNATDTRPVKDLKRRPRQSKSLLRTMAASRRFPPCHRASIPSSLLLRGFTSPSLPSSVTGVGSACGSHALRVGEAGISWVGG